MFRCISESIFTSLCFQHSTDDEVKSSSHVTGDDVKLIDNEVNDDVSPLTFSCFTYVGKHLGNNQIIFKLTAENT